MRSSIWPIVLPMLVALVLPASAGAQTVRGLLVEQGSGRPIDGALVVLLDAGARQVAGSLTDARGRFTIEAPAPGEYRLRAERIGHANTVSEVFTAAAGAELERRLIAPVEVISLEGVIATSGKRCQLSPAAGVQTQALWEEARKALNATAWSGEQALFQYRLTEFARELEAGTGRVGRQETRSTVRSSTTPYVSASPETLAAEGYVQREGDELIYFAPDAEHLLSEEFLNSHCFRVVVESGDGSDLVGLAFEPLRGRRLPDLAGTLWLNRETAYLSHLEYRYTGISLPAGAKAGDAGGRLAFERLPNGAWIVQRWHIRMPLVEAPGPGASPDQMRAGSRLQRVAGVREEGGEVMEILGRGRPGAVAERQATLRGVVTDESSGDPVEGATVFLSGTGYSVGTARDGSWELVGVPAGRYSVSFFHPRLTALGILADPVEIEVTPAQTLELRLALSGEALRLAGADLCPGLPRNTGGVAGFVSEAERGRRVASADVEFRWSRFELGEDALRERWYGLAVSADQSGFYSACELPSDRTLRARAHRGEQISAEAALNLTPGTVREHDFVIEAPAR